jgi:DNA polymerase-3 subunit beta
MLIEGENSSVKIKGLEADAYPALPITGAKGGEVIEINQKDLKDLINKTAFAVCADPQRAPLNGEQIKISNGYMNGTASDGNCVAIRRIKTSVNEFEAVILGKVITDISKILENQGTVKIYKNRNQVLFETDSYLVTANTLTGEYFDFPTFFRNDFAASVEIKTKELRNALEAVFPFIPSTDMSKNPPLFITVEGNKINVNYSSEFGESNSEITAKKVEGSYVKNGFNPKMLINAIKSIDDESIILQFLGGFKPVFIAPVEGNEFFHICAPVRIEKG